MTDVSHLSEVELLGLARRCIQRLAPTEHTGAILAQIGFALEDVVKPKPCRPAGQANVIASIQPPQMPWPPGPPDAP